MTARMVKQEQSYVRAITSSLIAGVVAMTVVGAVGSFIVHGGLDTPTAAASTPDERFGEIPVIRPLDVRAVQAQLAQAEAAMRVTQDATARSMARLERLSHE